MAKLNSNNYCIWYDSLPSNEPCYYSLPLQKNDTISIYTNFEILDSQIDNTQIVLSLWSDDLFDVYLNNIVTLNKIFVGTGYQVYTDDWIVPDLPPGTYRFLLRESTTNKFYSNTFISLDDSIYTSKVKYRNSENALGYQYETASSFYNQFRVDLRTGNPSYNENVKGYQTYEGNFIQTKSDIQKPVEFNTRFLDQIGHEAFFSMLAHSEFYIDDVRYKKGEQSDYQIEWSEFDDNRIGNGTVNLLEADYSSSIRNC